MIIRITLRKLFLPLRRPYRLSYRTFTEFEPYFVEVQDSEGRVGYADAHVSPGSSAETREGAWKHLTERLPKLIGRQSEDAIAFLRSDFSQSKVATTAATVAIESLIDDPLARVDTPNSIDLLVPIGASDPEEIEREVEAAVSAGYSTLKVKVGKDVESDLKRLSVIQSAATGRAKLRVDANRAYSKEDALAFVRHVNPDGISLFEQPCEADAWQDNADVAAASSVPIMLDEPICTLADIERAADIEGVQFCKVKLKRFGGLRHLRDGIKAIVENGMQAVLGDGLGSDLHGWYEAAVASRCINNAGEFNGFIKMQGELFAEPLLVERGQLQLAAGSVPVLNSNALTNATKEVVEFR